MTKIFKELYETKNYPILLFVKQEINMGDIYNFDFKLDKEYFEIKDRDVYIRKNQNIYARQASNKWLEIKLEDGTFLDVAFDEVEDYDNYFEIQGRNLLEYQKEILKEYIAPDYDINCIKNYNCLNCGEEYSSDIKDEHKKCICVFCED